MVDDLACLGRLGMPALGAYNLYQVTPVGPVYRHDYKWLAQAHARVSRLADVTEDSLDADQEVGRLILSYWYGSTHPDPDCQTEYLTERMCVEARLGRY